MKTKILLRDFPALKVFKSGKEAEDLFENTLRLFRSSNYSEGSIKNYVDQMNRDREKLINFLTTVDLSNVDGYSDTFEKAAEDSSDCIFDTLESMGKGNLIIGLGKLLGLAIGECKTGVVLTQREYGGTIHKEYSVYSILRAREDIYVLDTVEIDSNKFHNRPYILYTTTETYAFKQKDKGIGHAVSVTGFGKEDSRDCGNSVAVNLTWLIRFLAFKKLANTETLNYPVVDDTKIKPGLSNFQKQYELGKQEPYIYITYYSANWYRDIICDHEFRVRGHWRMQACGENHQERRLVFIAPFTKNGYHRRAQKDVCQLEGV